MKMFVEFLLFFNFVYIGLASEFINTNESEIASNPSQKGFYDNEEMRQCNLSFNINPEFLQELNDTGSFPDEVEMTPMCFLKCYLESIGVLDKELQINRIKAVELYNLNDDSETYDNCADDMSSENVTDECEKAYFFVRCVMSRKLFDNLEEDEMV